MSTAYISGHLKISKEEFEHHYKLKIDEAIKQGDDFVICDAHGVDVSGRTIQNSCHGTRKGISHV